MPINEITPLPDWTYSANADAFPLLIPSWRTEEEYRTADKTPDDHAVVVPSGDIGNILEICHNWDSLPNTVKTAFIDRLKLASTPSAAL